MDNTRRDFLRGTAWMGAAAIAAGCRSGGLGLFGGTDGAPMHGFACKPLKKVRIGIVGMGSRGRGCATRASQIPGAEVVAICDIAQNRLDMAQAKIAEQKKPRAREFLGPEAYRALCDFDQVDVVYNTTPWNLHVPVALAAMRAGKHVFTEVPSAFTVDDCWELVETSEATKRHCMQLENCCYGEIEMLTLNLVRLGLLGEIVHAEGAYIHDLRDMCKAEWPALKGEYWRYPENRDHAGNRYPTHGLVPLCLTMNVNRGDRLDYLVSLESNQVNFTRYMKEVLPADHPRRKDTVAMADMNSTLIKLASGRSMLIQHDVSSPRPYSRIQLVSGTKGVVCDYPFRVGFEEKVGDGIHEWYGEERAKEVREKYRHPMWKQIGEIAQKVGGHGGMDFIMDLRWVYCLQNGLPLDMDVYDLATTCSLCELTEKSVKNRSRSYDIPDFTRGAWRTNRPLGIESFDMSKIRFDIRSVRTDRDQLNV